jgi:hypothetical protein
MSEPAEYIFQEWDSMCARANNSLRGSCPLLEDEVLVEMHKYLGGLESKLAAAEAEIATLRDTLVLIDNRCYQDEWVVDTIAEAMGEAGHVAE